MLKWIRHRLHYSHRYSGCVCKIDWPINILHWKFNQLESKIAFKRDTCTSIAHHVNWISYGHIKVKWIWYSIIMHVCFSNSPLANFVCRKSMRSRATRKIDWPAISHLTNGKPKPKLIKFYSISRYISTGDWACVSACGARVCVCVRVCVFFLPFPAF